MQEKKPENYRALSDEAFEQIELDVSRGMRDDWQIQRLIDSVRIQRTVLRQLFSYFREEPLRLVTAPESVRVATLDELKTMVAMEDR